MIRKVEMQMYNVLSPLGERAVEEVAGVRPVSDLSGKTVGEMSDGLFRSDVTFPMIRELLQKRYPGIKVIPYTEFPIQDVRGNTEDLLKRAETAAALAVERGCDAVISGNGF